MLSFGIMMAPAYANDVAVTDTIHDTIVVVEKTYVDVTPQVIYYVNGVRMAPQSVRYWRSHRYPAYYYAPAPRHIRRPQPMRQPQPPRQIRDRRPNAHPNTKPETTRPRNMPR